MAISDMNFVRIDNEIINLDKITRVEIRDEKIVGEEQMRKQVVLYCENSETTLMYESAENFLKSIHDAIKISYA